MHNKEPSPKFLIINPFGIGDVLFTTPVIRAIKDSLPDARISFWCNERTAGILKSIPEIENIFALSRGDLKKIYRQSFFLGLKKSLGLFFRIKNGHFDVTMDFSLDHRYGLVSKLAGIRRRIGLNYRNRGKFLTDKIDIKEGYTGRHVVEYYLDLLKFLNIVPKEKRLFLIASDTQKMKSRILLESFGIKETDLLVGIAPGAGASWGKNALLKHWPVIRFAQLAERIIEVFGAKVLILGSPSEAPISEAISYSMKKKPVDLVGRITLEELPAVISNLKLLIANDGGVLHIGVALGIKTVSIFGPVDEQVYGAYPESIEHIVIKKSLLCRPCYRNFRLEICNMDRECLNSISTNEVFDAVRIQLS
ncbi:MAG: glycosyltransferase family 9 protein [Candidatus Omnitrophica bacterium]|nr:glycosyltransferase family 9 protein [Candidatus Omnitrophota bacterium]